MVQEQYLTDYILHQETLGQNCTYMQIRTFAGRILIQWNNAKPLGKKWITGFLYQNPILQTKKQFRIDSQ